MTTDADEKKIIETLKANMPRSHAVFVLGGAVQWVGSYIAASCRKKNSRRIGITVLIHLTNALQQVEEGGAGKEPFQEASGLLAALRDGFMKEGDPEMAQTIGGVVDQLAEAAASAERAAS